MRHIQRSMNVLRPRRHATDRRATARYPSAAVRSARRATTRRGALCLAGTVLIASVGLTHPVGAQGDSTAQRATARIRAIRIYRAPVFDSSETHFWGYRLLNALRVETRPFVIRRELLFAAGEPYDSARVRETERNLRALGIFRDVMIDTVTTDSGVVVRVHTIDAWTTTPGFNVSSSGSQSAYGVSVQDINVLGTGTIGLLGYENNPDRSSVIAAANVPRLIRNRVGVSGSYFDLSDGRVASAGVRLPFVSLESRAGVGVDGQWVDARVLRFANGDPSPIEEWHRHLDFVRADAALAVATAPSAFARLGFMAQVRREDYVPEGTTGSIPHSVFVAAGPTLVLRHARYIRAINVQSIGRVEDIDLGWRVGAQLLAAPRLWGYDRDGIGGALGVGVGMRFPWGFGHVDGSMSGVRSSAGIDSATVEASGTLVFHPDPQNLLVAHAEVGSLTNPQPGGEWDLGLGYGARAFPQHAFSGDRKYLLNAEYRWLAVPELFGLVGVSLATYFDQAGAWYQGDSPRHGTDAGIGLRIGSLREAGSIVWRLDLSRRFANDVLPAGWVFSIGRGFAFERR